MLVWIPWVWIKRIGLMLVALTIALSALGWWTFRPRSVPPAQDWAAQWNTLADATHSEAAELYALTSDICDTAITSTPDEASDYSQLRTAEALDALRFAEWGHPAHNEGVAALGRLHETIELCTIASRVPPRAQSIEHDVPANVEDAEALLDDLIRLPSVWHASLRRVLVAEMRVAANTGRISDSVAAFDALLALAGHQAAYPGMTGKLAQMSIRITALAQAAAIASSGERSPELLRSYLDVLDAHFLSSIDIENALQAERIVGEISIWIEAKQTSSAPLSDVLRSFTLSMLDADIAHDPSLWRRRRLNYSSKLQFLDRWIERTQSHWNISADQLNSALPEPVYAPYPEYALFLLLPDPGHRFRRIVINHAIHERAYRNVITIALFKAENGTLPATLAEAVGQDACVIPHTNDQFVYTLTDASPGYSLRLPQTPAIRAIDPQWSSDLGIPEYSETEFAAPFRPINPDDFVMLEWNESGTSPYP